MIEHKTPDNPLSLDDIFPQLINYPLGRPIKNFLEKATGLSYLSNGYSQLNTRGQPEDFVQKAFNSLNISYDFDPTQINNIPQYGATIVVANHPYGAIDGMAMIDLLSKHRPDIKVMANGILKRIREINDIIISVNPYDNNNSRKENARAMRECILWLKQGGLIFMFPAGDVSSLQLSRLGIYDNTWDTKVARLAQKTSASIVPVHINGRNSTVFYLASAIHPRLKTLLLPRQIIKKRGSNIKIRIGRMLSSKKLSRINDVNRITDLIKYQTYQLSHKTILKQTKKTHYSDIIDAIPGYILASEINQLPEQNKLIDNGEVQVFYAIKHQIPSVMAEIARLREISFRSINEGTGKSSDVDIYDEYYTQLFIWNSQAEEIIGGYRLGLSDNIINTHKESGLYTHSLFKYKQEFIVNQKPSIELGRSFVRPEYQRSFSPLLLLWKGISQFVYQHPKYCILYGPVSISNDYCTVSKNLLITYLEKNLLNLQLSEQIKPRSPYKAPRLKNLQIPDINNISLEELSTLISSFEDDDKGIPVLIRQYLKLGGEILGFNVDTNFGDCVDGLIRVDLRQTDQNVLAKYMGKDKAVLYRAFHNSRLELAS